MQYSETRASAAVSIDVDCQHHDIEPLEMYQERGSDLRVVN